MWALPDRGLNPFLLHWGWILYPRATREAQYIFFNWLFHMIFCRCTRSSMICVKDTPTSTAWKHHEPSTTEPPALISRGPGWKLRPILNSDRSHMPPVSPGQLLSHHRDLTWGYLLSNVRNSPQRPTSTSPTSSPMMQIRPLLFKSERDQYESQVFPFSTQKRIYCI